ncbi:DUF4054 domain-containing protein [Kosakonia sacchari]|uniref:DUF4054 domain-containing protein n=1 Tax=Kosakonia sacchari TaxID=1158459 RepID=UPI0015847C47|nr:DUF4054 domain-containing protein [Kosakonia sacchari]NUL35048.1 DUF4054 domain-containing protein [Kosakonia sacchari]
MTVDEWLIVLVPGITFDGGAVSALSTQCAALYDMEAAEAAGYDTSYLTALYVVAHLAPALVEGVTGNLRTVSSRKEGKVSVTFTKESQKAGWKGTTWGQEFLDAMRKLSGGGGVVGHAD